MSLLSSAPADSHAQTRTRTTPPHPTVSKSVAWITNIPYVGGGGSEQQLDLYLPTNQKGEPLVVYVHGGGWAAGDKAGDSINPNNLQWFVARLRHGLDQLSSGAHCPLASSN
jgi:acetyl esterase/lipase